MKITIVGIGYVGLGVGVTLSTKHNVTMLDIDEAKIGMVNSKKSPIKDSLIGDYLSEGRLNLTATTDSYEAYKGAEFIIVAVPTNYDEDAGKFDTRVVEGVVTEAVMTNPEACVVIKSTIPVGYTTGLRERLRTPLGNKPNIIFSPEFLREGTALADSLHPSRVIAGCDMGDESQVSFGNRYLEIIRSVTGGGYRELLMGSTEAEAVKLFANTYLAMRVAYFNELDTYAASRGLNTREIIDGVCCDPRIGEGYNNPSFGYGGYCFPKDTKQLLSNFKNIPQDMISAVVASNVTRKLFIANAVERFALNAKEDSPVIGVYRLSMKTESDNSRMSAVLDIINELKSRGFIIRIFEPTVEDTEFSGCEVVKSLDDFKKGCDIILANRLSLEIIDVRDKIYTRDIFGRD